MITIIIGIINMIIMTIIIVIIGTDAVDGLDDGFEPQLCQGRWPGGQVALSPFTASNSHHIGGAAQDPWEKYNHSKTKTVDAP